MTIQVQTISVLTRGRPGLGARLPIWVL